MRITIVNPIAATPDVTARGMLRPSVPCLLEPEERIRQVNIVELASAIARKGHEVDVVVAGPFLRGKGVAVSENLHVVPVDTVLEVPFHPGLFPLMPELAEHAALRDADVIQVGEFHQPSTVFAAKAARSRGTPLVLWQETFEHMRFPGSVYQRGFEAAFGRRVVGAVREFVPRTSKAQRFLASLGVAPEAIHPWIPTGIDVSFFSPQAPSLTPADFGWPPDARIVLVVGRLHAVKGVDTALRCLRELQAHMPEVRLLIAGSGPERAALETLARELGIEASVRFLSQVPRKETVPLYNLADLVLAPSRSDLLPFSLIEASACGRACVATDVGAVTDIVVDGVTGAVVPAGDVDGLGRRTLELLRDDERRVALGRRARERATNHFNVETVADRMVEAYHAAAS